MLHFLDYLRNTCDDFVDCSPVPPFLHPFSTLPALLSSLPLKKREKSNFKKRGRGRLQRGLRVKVQIKNEVSRKKTMQIILHVQYLVKGVGINQDESTPRLNYTNNRFYWHLGLQRRENWGRDRWRRWKIKTKSFFLTLSEMNSGVIFFSFFCTL